MARHELTQGRVSVEHWAPNIEALQVQVQTWYTTPGEVLSIQRMELPVANHRALVFDIANSAIMEKTDNQRVFYDNYEVVESDMPGDFLGRRVLFFKATVKKPYDQIRALQALEIAERALARPYDPNTIVSLQRSVLQCARVHKCTATTITDGAQAELAKLGILEAMRPGRDASVDPASRLYNTDEGALGLLLNGGSPPLIPDPRGSAKTLLQRGLRLHADVILDFLRRVPTQTIKYGLQLVLRSSNPAPPFPLGHALHILAQRLLRRSELEPAMLDAGHDFVILALLAGVLVAVAEAEVAAQ
ncbi:hypothetical protein TSOC_006144 [Tetrabaena socialis]|uniref:Uncharacterized protein n=1 Tax=Tetrabaena socialis TaxID=47790 RepID=A0A2J8A4G3_9CHLO|nr:hypothetical protein TSOC_006144 [Tetrabaena socialis]|eukprot:PNH07398.1 hypothetical protein TSOC_006144 [Tetrabaena socialis]